MAGLIEDWNRAFLEAVRKETPPPCLVTRNLVIFHVAIFEAVKEFRDRQFSEAAQERAAHIAAGRVFSLMFPSEIPPVVQKDSDADALVRAVSLAKVAEVMKSRENDGSSTTVHYVPSEKLGQWRRTPPRFRPPEFPHWGKVKPFFLPDVTKFRASPPPPLTSEQYAADLNRVKEIGGATSTLRTDEQTMIAKFWSDFSYTTSPGGHWNDIARAMSLKRGLKVAESARLFAVLNVALADTCITIWDTKYYYNFWRPCTAIQRADEDGNDATAGDKAWQSLLPCPPHPEYVSGHSGLSGASATVLEHFFGSGPVAFEADSDTVKDTKRHFTSFSACAEEIAQSRVYAGIHFPSAGREGLKLGRKVAEAVLAGFKE